MRNYRGKFLTKGQDVALARSRTGKDRYRPSQSWSRSEECSLCPRTPTLSVEPPQTLGNLTTCQAVILPFAHVNRTLDTHTSQWKLFSLRHPCGVREKPHTTGAEPSQEQAVIGPEPRRDLTSPRERMSDRSQPVANDVAAPIAKPAVFLDPSGRRWRVTRIIGMAALVGLIAGLMYVLPQIWADPSLDGASADLGRSLAQSFGGWEATDDPRHWTGRA